MAFTISTIYKAVDNLSPALKMMQNSNNKFASAQNASFSKMQGTFSNMQSQLLGLAGNLSVASLFGIGTKAIVDYDTALASLSAITGVSGKAFEAFKGQVLTVATNTKQSAVDVAKAFELVGSAKPELLANADALAKVSEAAITLSKASRDDLATSARNLTGVLNQFNLGADQSSRAINVLGAGAVVGAANISQINEAMTNVGAVANSANMSLEQTVAAVEVLGSKQLFGAEAGTKLRGVILRLQAAGMGYKSGQFQINDALEEANKKIAKMSSAKSKDALMSKIFGAENITAGKIILSNTKMFDEMTKGVTGTNIAYEQAATNSATFSVRLQQLKARFENLIIKGNESSGALNVFGKALGFITDHLGVILTVIGSLIGLYTSWYVIQSMIRIGMVAFNIMLGITNALQGASAFTVMGNVVAYNAYRTAVVIATAAQWLWNAALTANPIGIIIVAIGALIIGIALLIKYWDKVKATMDKWSNSAIFQIISLFVPILKIIELIGFFQDRWTAIKKAFSEGGFLEGIKAIGKTLLSFVLKPLEVILRALSKIPGLGFLAKGADSIGAFRNSLDEGMVEKKPAQTANPHAAQSGVMTQKFEEINKQKLDINLTNRTDKDVNISNPNNIPLIYKTYNAR